jgi:hypothetical protein
MTSRILPRIVAAALFSAAFAWAPARAYVITFVGPIGTPVAPAVEGIFSYSTFSGGLYRDTQGNGDAFDMEGCSVCGGGVLQIVRNDVAGGLFTFDGSDVAFQFSQAYGITFQGYLGGVLVGTDVFATAADSSYLTYVSSALAGVAIDELRIVLDAQPNFATVIDNVVVNVARVPEPATLGLLGIALAGIALSRRRR